MKKMEQPYVPKKKKKPERGSGRKRTDKCN